MTKEDTWRAQAVMDHIHRTLARRGGIDAGNPLARQILSDLEPWLMAAFRAVRGET